MKAFFEAKIKKFWLEHELKIILLVGFILIAGVAFESGYLKGKTAQNNPVVIEKPVQVQNSDKEGTQASNIEVSTSKESQSGQTGTQSVKNCAYAGSKNSNKYHLPSSSCAKRIKPENLVCFSSIEDAQAKGYKAGCLK